MRIGGIIRFFTVCFACFSILLYNAADIFSAEKTPIKEDSSINVTLTLLIPIVDDKGYPVLDENGKPTFNRENKVKLGTFYTTEVDRQTIGMLKIKAIDAMGHINKLDTIDSLGEC